MSAPVITARNRAAQTVASALRADALATRNARIRAIQTARRQLGLDDATYRAMLQRLTGKTSSADMTAVEHRRVLDHLRQAGAVHPLRQNRDAGLRRPRPDTIRADMMAKIHALLDELGRVTGQPHTLAYADAICQRHQWASSVDLCTPQHLHSVVGALSRTLRSKAAGGHAT